MSNTQISQDYLNLTIAPALRDFMCNNHTDLNDAVDWVCYTFDLDATDDLIDFVADEYEAFHGIWLLLKRWQLKLLTSKVDQ